MTPFLAAHPRLDRSFERLYRRHATDVYRYAYGVLRNRADAEDVTQTTFLNAYRALERGEEPRAALNWLIAIAHNVCRQRFRTASRRPHEVEFDEDVAEGARRRRRRPDRRRRPPRARPSRVQPAGRARPPRDRGPLVRGDRECARRLDERGRDTRLPRPPGAARAARGRAHVRAGRARDLEAAGQDAHARRALAAPGPPAGVSGVRDARAPAARAAHCAADARVDPAPAGARRPLLGRRGDRRARGRREGDGGRRGGRSRRRRHLGPAPHRPARAAAGRDGSPRADAAQDFPAGGISVSRTCPRPYLPGPCRPRAPGDTLPFARPDSLVQRNGGRA